MIIMYSQNYCVRGGRGSGGGSVARTGRAVTRRHAVIIITVNEESVPGRLPANYTHTHVNITWGDDTDEIMKQRTLYYSALTCASIRGGPLTSENNKLHLDSFVASSMVERSSMAACWCVQETQFLLQPPFNPFILFRSNLTHFNIWEH